MPLKLPRKLTVQVDQCGAAFRPYTPGGAATICYELVEQIEAVAAKADPSLKETVIVGTFVQAVFHEVATAVLDILQVPVWGRRDDAADRLAGFIMLQFGEEVARRTVAFVQISLHQLTHDVVAGAPSPVVDERRRRSVTQFFCMAYGRPGYLSSGQARRQPEVDPPPDRADRCQGSTRKYARLSIWGSCRTWTRTCSSR